MNKRSFLVLTFLCLFILTLPPLVFALNLSGDFYPAQVKDISDRRYEPAVIELLDSAKESIVLSMYIIKAEEKPVTLLLKDLDEALERGVRVEIYLNTKEDRGVTSREILRKRLAALIKKGAKIYEFTPNYRLHDKLIIVDEQYVVEGSMNWSVTAIKTNHESAVLIESPELAREKLLRLRRFPLRDDKNDNAQRPDRPKCLEPLPEGAVVNISKDLLYDKKLFPEMVRRQANRSMDAYLLLLAESTRLGKREFFIPLEDMAIALGMPPEWTDTALRRQAIRVLKDLQNRYKLIDVNFSYGKDAWIELKELAGDTFTAKGEFFAPSSLTLKTQPAKFVSLITKLLAAEGKNIESFSVKELSERFHTSEHTIRTGLKELQRGDI